MANWSNPTLASSYTSFLSELKARDEDLATMFQGSPTNVPTNTIRWNATTNKFEKWSGSAWVDLTATYGIAISGNAGTATRWATGRTITLTGDVTGASAAFDGSGNLSFAATLANSGVTAGTYTKVTVDAKGRVTAGTTLAAADIPATLDSNARLAVRVNTGGSNTGSRRRLNVIAGTGIVVTAADDSGNEEIDLTIATTGLLATTGGTLTGNLLIQRSGASSSLVVGDAAAFNASVRLTNAAGNYREILFQSANANRFIVRVSNAAESGSNAGSDFAIARYDDAGSELSTPLFINRSTGYMGVNQTAPTEQLHVQGNILASGDIQANSDARLKTDVATIEGALARVLALRGVTYTKDGERHMGLIAQETQPHAPEVVRLSGEYLTVAYGNLVGLLVEAVKELTAEVRGR